MFKRLVSVALVLMMLSCIVSVFTKKETVTNQTTQILEVSQEADQLKLEVQQEETQPTEAEVITDVVTQLGSQAGTQIVDAAEFVAAEAVKEPIYFGSEITFTTEFIADGYVMPHALYTPSTASESEKIPLIVWLHGSGERNADEKTFYNRGLPAVMEEWKLEGFNAYIVCPQLKGSWNTGTWNNDTSKDYLRSLIDRYIEEYNVDPDNIIIIGHSLGGQGALYMANRLPEYFSRCVVLSGYNPSTSKTKIVLTSITIPTIGFVGKTDSGEDNTSVSYMKGHFVPAFGEENCFSIKTSHGGVPKVVFNLDENNNNRSDLIEWMFGLLDFNEDLGL